MRLGGLLLGCLLDGLFFSLGFPHKRMGGYSSDRLALGFHGDAGMFKKIVLARDEQSLLETTVDVVQLKQRSM